MRPPLRFARVLALGCLPPLVLTRVSSLLEAPHDLAFASIVLGVAATLALVGTQAALVVGRGFRGLAAVQLVLTFGPYLLLGAAGGPVAGVVGATALLTSPGRRGWGLFTAVIAADWVIGGALRWEQGLPVVVGVLLVDLMVGFTLFAVVRLAQLVHEADEIRQRLVAAEVEAERLRVADRLRESVGTRLSAIVHRVRRARETPTADALLDLGALAQQTVADVRAAAVVSSASKPVGPASSSHIPLGVPYRFAWWMLVVLVVIYSGHAFARLAQTGADTVHWLTGAAFVVAGGVLQIRHSGPRDDGSARRAWVWTLSAQVLLLIAAAIVVTGTWILPPAMLAAGTVLIRWRAPWSWILVAAAAASLGFVPLGYGVSGSVYWSAWMVAASVSVYALWVLPEITRDVHETRDQLTRVAVVAERLRFARDIHDLLGIHLSAVRLKCELAFRALPTDEAKALDHLADVQRSVEAAISEVRSITSATELDLRYELSAAQELLHAADVDVSLDVVRCAAPPEVDHILGVIVREAVTNVIRHSHASRCTMAVSVQDGSIRLSVANDGVTRPVPAGETRDCAGLVNLTARAEALGGSLTTAAEGGTFTLVAAIPLAADARSSAGGSARRRTTQLGGEACAPRGIRRSPAEDVLGA